VIRLILGKINEEDSPQDNRYTRAAACFEQWRDEKTLVRDEAPTLYLTAVDFSVNGVSHTRYGLIAKVDLEPFEKKIILPHERTFSKVKSERLELMKTCKSNFSPIFGLYTDTGDVLDKLKQATGDRKAGSDLTDDKGHRHRMWRITDPAVCEYVQAAFRDKQIFIADGHHRYETALNYRNWLAETLPGFTSDHPANGIMMYLCSMNDPGLKILPAHRMLLGVPPEMSASLIQKAADHFRITPFSRDDAGVAALLSELRENSSGVSIGVLLKGQPDAYLFCLKDGAMDRLYEKELPPVLRDLDVTTLTRLIFMDLLGFDELRLDNEKSIAYTSIDDDAINAVAAANCDLAFILNPTSIEQVRAVAEEGLIMPRKSTYFYPKVITGQVFNCLKRA
jgi:uncharacterized protein (DUF1015 family)